MEAVAGIRGDHARARRGAGLTLLGLAPMTIACGARSGLPVLDEAEESCVPLPTCISATTLRSYLSPGTCSDGSCSYEHTDTTCPDGCSAGACTGYPVSSVSCGQWHSCAMTSGGAAKCWGDGEYGQLGDGSKSKSLVPVEVAGLGSEVIAVEAASYFSCALVRGGAIRCWGVNSGGQLGDGSTIDNPVPGGVVGLDAGVVAISAGSSHTCALTSTGGVECWGFNLGGKLGDGSTADSAVPVGVVGLSSEVIAISAGANHTCAVTSGGGVKCWGGNSYGELGDGSTTDSPVPVDVVGFDAGVVAIAAGMHHTCVLTRCGGTKCWGRDNVSSQQGSFVPIDVPGLSSDVAAIATHWGHVCALMQRGGRRCWGSNSFGQLGNNSTTDSLVPVDVAGLGPVVTAIAPGWGHTCASVGNGGVKCWGHNDYGQLGNNSVVGSVVPIDVVGF